MPKAKKEKPNNKITGNITKGPGSYFMDVEYGYFQRYIYENSLCETASKLERIIKNLFKGTRSSRVNIEVIIKKVKKNRKK